MTARWLAPAVGLLLALAVFGAALPGLTERFLGLEYVDHYGTQWFYWYVEHQLTRGEGFGHTDLFFHPWGKDVFAHTGSNVLDGILALPLRLLLGPVLGYNAFVLLGMLATGLAFWSLARDHSQDRVAAALGAVLFTLSPYLLHDLAEGRPTQAILVAPVLFFQQLLRAGRRRGLGPPLLGGLLLALSGYQYWYYALFCGLCALAHGVYGFLRPDPGAGGRWRLLGRHALMAAVALALVAPVAVPLAQAAAAAGEVPGLLRTDLWSLAASPPVTAEGQAVGLFVWQPLQRWAGFHVLDTELTEHLLEQALLLPWVWAPLALAFLWAPGPVRRGPVVAMALTAAVIATGSFVVVGEYALPNPVYLGLSKVLGVMQRLWWPARALSCFTILLGLALVAVLDRARQLGPRAHGALALGLSVAWGAELWVAGHVPFPSWDATIPAGHRCLATGPQGAVIELPHAWTQAHLYYQTSHGRPIMGGMLENNPVFTPEELTALREDNSFIDALGRVSRLASDEDVLYAPADGEAVRDLGYAYVLLQKDAYVSPEAAGSRADNVRRTRLRRMQKGLRRMLGPPVYDDARTAIYAPWGAAAPCDPAAVGPDQDAVGPTELHADAMVRGGTEAHLVRRVWERPLDGLVDLELAGEDEAGEGEAGEDEAGEDDTGAGQEAAGGSGPAGEEQHPAPGDQQDQAPAD